MLSGRELGKPQRISPCQDLIPTGPSSWMSGTVGCYPPRNLDRRPEQRWPHKMGGTYKSAVKTDSRAQHFLFGKPDVHTGLQRMKEKINSAEIYRFLKYLERGYLVKRSDTTHDTASHRRESTLKRLAWRGTVNWWEIKIQSKRFEGECWERNTQLKL